MPTLNLYDASRQPGRHRDRQRRRRPQRRHRLDGTHLGQLPGADRGRRQGQPGRVHDRHPGRHGRPVPVQRDLDQSGRRQRHQLPASTMTVVGRQQHPADVGQPHPTLTIDGNAATGVTVVDNHTLSFSLPDDSPTASTASRSAAWSTSTAWRSRPTTSRFTTDTVPPYIVSSSLADGTRLLARAANVTEVVTFSEPMNTSLTPSIDLFGEIRGIDYAPASDTLGSDRHDPDDPVQQPAVRRLPVQPLHLRLPGPGRQLPWSAASTINFTVRGGTSAHHRPARRSCRWAAWSTRARSTTCWSRRATSTPTTWRSIPTRRSPWW